jgi:exopolysaccharide biosynthesis WecB/TagA/CpsF family protein
MSSLKSIEHGCITFLNHFSLQQGMLLSVNYKEFTGIGVDGSLLRMILQNKVEHNSADLYLPELLQKMPLKVFVIGGTSETCKANSELLANRFSLAKIVGYVSGDSDGLRGAADGINQTNPDLVIVGLGPGLQDIEALRLWKLSQSVGGSRLFVTCGGWLDQLQKVDYFPKWAYFFKLNWLLRLAREPRRLWKRYSYWAFRSIAKRHELRKSVSEVNWLG